MELAVGAMGSLVPKLGELLQDEFVKQMGLRREVESLCRELPMMEAALVEVSKVPPEQLSETDKVWARRVRELSYDMEDAVDNFMVSVASREPSKATAASNVFTKAFKDLARKTKAPLKKLMARHQISDEIRDIKDLSKELSDLRAKYAFNSAAYAANTHDGGVDPRVINLRKNEGRELVGIEEARDDLLRMLTSTHPPDGDGGLDNKGPLKVVSIVGFGGLGKTTLATLVHHQLKAQPSFHCSAFVSVGQNPNITSTLREMLEKLIPPKQRANVDMASWTGERFCDELYEFLRGKRYNIVVDDVWEKETWDTIKCALPDSNCGSKVIMTTRKFKVGTKANDVYKLKPLSDDKSKELFCIRTSTKNNGDNQLVDKIIGKCDGVPLAIIAIASLLADKPLEDWQTVYDSLILGHEDTTRKILLYSYYDLPPHLKPCMLYLSMYPEDCSIEKSALIWRWIAEGFVQLQKEGCCSLLEVGERYFDELLNRSMIQVVFNDFFPGTIVGCRVHDIVLDLIRDLSMEENFVTILGKKQLVESSASVTRSMKELGIMHGLERKVRRLSIHSDIPLDAIGMPEVVRSLQTTDDSIEVSQLSSFRSCRVLSISSSIGDLKHLEKLLHLRYLEIHDDFDEFPKELGNLKSLQTLTVTNREEPVSPAIFELTQLMCLNAYIKGETVIKIGNLVCLEELKLMVSEEIGIHDLVVALGKLTKLRVLWIEFEVSWKDAWYRELMQCLNKLQEIRELILLIDYDESNWAETTWEPPRETNMGLSPRLMDPSCFRRLRHLRLHVLAAEAGDTLRNLAPLPELRSLLLVVSRGEPQGFMVVADGFQNLRYLRIKSKPTKPKFLQGAMPRLESLKLKVRPGRDLEEINLATLLSLKEVILKVICYGHFCGDVEEAKDVMRREVKDHPNHPTLHISRKWEKYIPDDDMKPDKVVCVPVIVRDCLRDDKYSDDVGMRYYRWLEEITCDIDCEGSSLSHLESVEARLRFQAYCHPRRPKLVMNRMNQDKMVGSLED